MGGQVGTQMGGQMEGQIGGYKTAKKSMRSMRLSSFIRAPKDGHLSDKSRSFGVVLVYKLFSSQLNKYCMKYSAFIQLGATTGRVPFVILSSTSKVERKYRTAGHNHKIGRYFNSRWKFNQTTK